MARFTRTTVIDAPLEAVWTFHSTIDGLETLTPSWFGLQVKTIQRPAGATGPELVSGTHLVLETRPLGWLPGSQWSVKITDRMRQDDRAMFRDEQVTGPFGRWEHTHWFLEFEAGTVVHDVVDYTLPGPLPDRLLSPALALLFAERHRRTRQRLAVT